MNALLLALDTAGDTLSYALHDGAALLAEHSWRAARQPTTQLAPAVAGSLADFGGAAALAALAVSLGPGSYTGLRSGIALAQGLAEAQGLPLVGIGAHEGDRGGGARPALRALLPRRDGGMAGGRPLAAPDRHRIA